MGLVREVENKDAYPVGDVRWGPGIRTDRQGWETDGGICFRGECSCMTCAERRLIWLVLPGGNSMS